MADDTNTAPTADQVAAAQAVLARKAAADQAALDAAKAPVRGLIAVAGFEDILAGATTIRGSLEAGSPFWEHCNAIVIGMTNLKIDAA